MDGRQWTRDLISKKYKCGDKQLRKGIENKGQSVLDIHTIKKNYLKLECCIPKNENSRESLRTLFQHNLLAAVEP